MGSGSINADAELQYGFRDDMTVEEGKELCIKAITAGILYDLGSGSNVDIMIIRRDGQELLRNHKIVGKKETIVENPFKIVPRNLVTLKTEKIEFGEEKEGMIIED